MLFKCIVAYDGSAYSGWQKQPNFESVQEKIEEALKIIHHKEICIVGSGRTDAKVHALGQVFHFESENRMDMEAWKQALNRLLPKDIRIKSMEYAPADFHARFSARSKRYDYLITRDMDNPFLHNYMARDSRILDIAKMTEAAAYFVGEHDFTSFTSNKINALKSRTKTITRVDVIEHDAHVQMIFEGNGFLRYMVRMMAQTLIEVGMGNITPIKVKEMLEAKDKHICHYKADPCGLYLVKVNYEE